MNDILKLGGILMLFTAISASSLAGIYSITKPRIELKKQQEIENALSLAIPTADKDVIKPVYDDETIVYYTGYTTPDTSEIAGYAFVAYGPGYSSTIETMVGVDQAGKIIGLKVLSQTETPGLGTKVEEIKYGDDDPWFSRQFIGKSAQSLAVDKDGGEINSITGATISSRALTNSVVSGYDEFLKKIQAN